MSIILATQLCCCRQMSSRVRSPKQKTRAMLDRMLRVDHAGEYGAVRIYEGQLAVLGRTKEGKIINSMKKQEEHHLNTFSKLLPRNRVRPTVMLPIWNIAGFVLGAGSALLGKEGAMACTVAVETSIGQHYDSQLRTLMADGVDGAEQHKELIEVCREIVDWRTIRKFRDEELEHLDTGLEHDAEKAPFYNILSETIKAGCRGAIWISERI